MIKLIKNFEKKDYTLVLLIVILIVVQVWLDLKMPDYMSEITKLVKTEGSNMSDILYNGGFMLLCSLGSLTSTIISGYFLALLSSRFSSNIRKKLFYKVESLSLNEIKKFETSSLITRTTNDISQVEMLIGMGLQLLIKAPITAVWAICKIVNKSFAWTLATSISVIIMLTVVTILTIVVIPKFKIVQKLIDKLNKVARENITGIRVIRAFNAEKYTKDKYEDVNTKLTNQQLFNQKAFAVMSPMMYLVMNMLALAIYIIGANLIMNANLSDKLTLFGDMIVFSSYSMQIIMSFLMLAMIFTVLPRAEVSANRINEVLDTESSIIDGTFDGKTETKGTVEFCNVSFKYPDAKEYILENISFKANKGETVAFIGSTGSGKSTLINLVPRFYDVTEGEVLVDGKNVKDYKLEKLYNKLGYVSQKAVIFNGSVKYNVAFGENGKKKDVKNAIKIAKAEDFVLNMDDKYDSLLSQGGTNISGGQKQRISIARAIARDPEIYIFDDSFSALDYKTDLELRKALKKNVKDATCLIVAQRIGTIMHADKIVVLDEGKCVGIGTHEELLKNCPVYKEIALSQISEEELENA
ncbi:MAG: ABC transporter ATP-binding protein/permease [Firmicutes bacterium]|nr:ABC transporter ATP-binding protein/permease [Bacillota bacterium]